MSDKKAQVLVLDPPVDLVFKGPFNEVVTSTLVLRNPTNDSVIFKVKTTAPKQYCVRPNSGLLGPKEEATISVMLQPFEQNSAEKSKHKFMVQTMIAPKKFQLDNLDTVWREASKNVLMDSKLRCVFLDSSGNLQDPTTSASSLSPNEGAPSNTAVEETYKSSVMPTAAANPTTPKQEVVTSTQSTAGSTPAHAGGGGSGGNANKEMERAAAESKMRMLQDRIDQLSAENSQLKSESNKLRQRIGAGAAGNNTGMSAITRRAGSLSLIAIIFILVAIVLGYLVGKWL